MDKLPSAYAWLAMQRGPRMLREALACYGVRETAGPGNTREIMAWADEIAGDVRRVYTADSIPWCGLFMAIVAQRAGQCGDEIVVRQQIGALERTGSVAAPGQVGSGRREDGAFLAHERRARGKLGTFGVEALGEASVHHSQFSPACSPSRTHERQIATTPPQTASKAPTTAPVMKAAKQPITRPRAGMRRARGAE